MTPPSLTSAYMVEFRSKALHLLPGDQGTPTQVPAGNIAVQRSPGSNLYVHLLSAVQFPYDVEQRLARCAASLSLLDQNETDWRALPQIITICVDLIDKTTHEIRQDDDKTVYKSLEEIGEDLPDHSPRFVLLSYPLTLVCPRLPCRLASRTAAGSLPALDTLFP